MIEESDSGSEPAIGRRTAVLSAGGLVGAVCVPASIAAAAPSVGAIERAIHAEVNERRSARGLPALAYNERLASDARGHSRAMANRGFFSHTAPGESSFADHYDAGCSGLAENIAYRTTRSEDAQSIAANVVDQWMGSSGHRRNILGEYATEGVGVALTSDGVLYATQAFGSGCATDASDGSGGASDGSDGGSSGDESGDGDETTPGSDDRRHRDDDNDDRWSWDDDDHWERDDDRSGRDDDRWHRDDDGRDRHRERWWRQVWTVWSSH